MPTLPVQQAVSVRPWQHVLEPLAGYLMLGAKMMEDPVSYSGAWNFGPTHNNVVAVKTLIEKLIEFYGKGEWQDISSSEKKHEANLLSLDISKANQFLKWCPVLSLNETIRLTVEWYKKYSTEDVFNLGLKQIKGYMEKWKSSKEI
jgi:CDP-glucose 4,6-dehydratase